MVKKRNITRAEKFFTEEEKKRIEETTRSAESKTIGEVAVMVVDSSDRYREAEIVGGILIAGLISLVISVAWFHSSVWSFVPAAAILFYPALLLFKVFPVLKKSFIGLSRMEEAVRVRAFRAFYEKGLHLTRQNTGVLFFISLLEHSVWVLADKGIYEKIHQDKLNEFAETISKGIKEGHACDALCEDIKKAGELLSVHFPLTSGDTN
jgi:putative membrane protein